MPVAKQAEVPGHASATSRSVPGTGSADQVEPDPVTTTPSAPELPVTEPTAVQEPEAHESDCSSEVPATAYTDQVEPDPLASTPCSELPLPTCPAATQVLEAAGQLTEDR